MDTLYDVISGIGGTLFGITITTLLNWKRNRRLTDMLRLNNQEMNALRLENEKLIGTVREKENLILELEKRILNTEKTKTIKPTKKRAK